MARKKRKRLSDAHKAKIAAALRGRRRSPETIAKMSAAMMGNKIGVGRKLSAASRERMGAAHKGNKYSLGIKRSAQWVAQLSERMKGNTFKRGWKAPPETRARQSAGLLARHGRIVLPSPAPGIMGFAPDYRAGRVVFFCPAVR